MKVSAVDVDGKDYEAVPPALRSAYAGRCRPILGGGFRAYSSGKDVSIDD